MVFDNYKFLLSSVVFLFVRKKVWCISFLLYQIAAVFFIADHSENNCILPFFNTHRAYAFLTKFTGDDVCSLALIHKFMEDKAYNLSAFLIDIHFTATDIIAKHTPSKYNALLHLAFLPPLYTLGSLAAFFLCNRGHNGKPKLCIAVHCVNTVIHKNDSDTVFFEVTGIINAVKGISGKTGDFLCDNQIKIAILGTRNHTVKLFSLFCVRTRDALIRKYFVKLPIGMMFNILLKISLLTFKRICLVFIVCGNTTVCSDLSFLIKFFSFLV